MGSLAVMVLTILGSSSCEECSTVETGIPCVFPFIYLNVTYTGCTNVGDQDGKLWCATSVDNNGVYKNSSTERGYCTPDCPDGDVETIGEISTRTVGEKLDDTDRKCGSDETCTQRNKCPQFLEKKDKFDQLVRGSLQYKESLKELRRSVCNKSKKGVCCPNPKKDDKCGRGYTCLKEAQCKFAQDLRKHFQSGDSNAKQELIELIRDRKDRTFCCPDLDERKVPIDEKKKQSWLPEEGECGLPHPDGTTSRIVGGVDTRPGQFSFTALLGYPERKRTWIDKKKKYEILDNIKYKCGGTLINHWYVVTAAHCQGSSASARISSVRLGEWEVGRPRDCLLDGDGKEIYCLNPAQDFEIASGQVIVHEGYQRTPSNVENDIALIRLPRPVLLNKGVQIVCLPLNPVKAAEELNIGNTQTGLEGTFPNVVGWGYTEYDPWATGQQGDFDTASVASKVQQRLGVPVLNSSECTRKFGKFEPLSSQICAGGELDKDSCKGDSGGPLYLSRVANNGEPTLDGTKPWYFMGIVSFGSRQCGSGKPGVYTRVGSFVPWIKKNLRLDSI